MPSRIEILFVIVCLVLTGVAYSKDVESSRRVAEAEFQRLTDESVQALRERMKSYVQTIIGTAAYVAASDDVTSAEFETYIRALEIDERLPSIAGLGHAVEVPDTLLDEFAREMRAEGRPDFRIRRRSDKDMHYILKFIEPAAENAKAVGLDLSFADDRVAVLQGSRATRTIQITPPVQLVQEDRSLPGFVTYMPIFTDVSQASGSPIFKGWINAPFVAENLLQGLTLGQGELYHLQVSDKTATQDALSIFDDIENASDLGAYTATQQFDQFGRSWILKFKSTTGFDAAFKSYRPILVLVAGLALTAFLVMILRSFQSRAQFLEDTARQSGLQARARAEENRSIVENAVISVLVLDVAGRILVANQAAQRCFGYTKDEIGEMHFGSLTTKITDPDENHNALGHAKDGRVLELDLQCNQWLTSDGEMRTTAIARDLTDQNKAQRELKRNKSLNDMALKGSEIGVFDIDLTTGLSDVSETWCRIMGYPEGCNGMNTQDLFLALIHPDDLGILQQADLDCIEGRSERSTAEYRLKSRDGGWRWMRSDAVVVERDSNNKALRLIGTQTDVTGLRRDRNALEASERQFRQVLANAPIGMALMDDTGSFRAVNTAFCQLTGRRESALVNGVALAELMPDDDRKTLHKSITALMQSGSASVYTAEHRILCGPDHERWGLVNVSWSFDKNVGSNLFIVQVVDITDQKRLELSKNEFVSTVSHELRTPLTSMKGALGLLTASNDNNLTEGQVRLIEIAGLNASRLTAIVNDILDLEKISSREVAFNLDEMDLAGVVETVVLEMAPFASTHDSSLRVEMSDEGLIVLADMGRTKQVLANLISNACKYSDQDSEVLIKAERLDDKAIVYIQNSGPGVPESFKNHIFKAFSQADSSDTRAKGGTGLGLNITRQIVLRHGGKIGYQSIPDGVTVFWFTMPLSETALQSTPEVAQLPVDPSCTKLAVLLVEDDPDFAATVADALDDFATVSHVKSIAAAKRLVDDAALDVVILDWGLSDGDADQLLDDILTLKPDVQVIALSADTEREADPRLFANMVKSRTDLAAVAAQVNRCQALAS